MTNRAVTTIVIIILLILGIWIWAANRDGSLPDDGIDIPTTTLPGLTPTTTSTSTATTTDNQSAAVITYTDSGYSPASLRVARGDMVTYRNNSSRSMWPASAMHPTHAVYPTTGGCLGSTFDACREIAPGGTWSFRFDVAGTWRYHDHLLANRVGTIIVE